MYQIVYTFLKYSNRDYFKANVYTIWVYMDQARVTRGCADFQIITTNVDVNKQTRRKA